LINHVLGFGDKKLQSFTDPQPYISIMIVLLFHFLQVTDGRRVLIQTAS